MLHDQKVGSVLTADVVEGANVGMVQRRDSAGFTVEALLCFGIVGQMCRENFYGDSAIESCIAGAIDLAHAACAKLRLDFIWTMFCAGGEGHGWRNYRLAKRRS